MNSGQSSSGSAKQDPARLTDGELIEACLGGDEDAWAQLIRRYGSLIYSIAYQYELGRDDAGDVFQLVSISLLEHLEDLRDATKLPAWIATITRRHAANVAARKRRQAGRDVEVAPHDEAAVDDRAVEELLSNLRDQMLVREAMERLPERCRELLTLLFSEEEDVAYAEIARRLDMPIGSIGPTRNRCLEQLRRILEEFGF